MPSRYLRLFTLLFAIAALTAGAAVGVSLSRSSATPASPGTSTSQSAGDTSAVPASLETTSVETPTYEVSIDENERCSLDEAQYFGSLSHAEKEKVHASRLLEGTEQLKQAQVEFDNRGVPPSSLRRRILPADFPLAYITDDSLANALGQSTRVVSGTIADVDIRNPWAVVTIKVAASYKGPEADGGQVRVLIPWFVTYDPGLTPECQLAFVYPEYLAPSETPR